MAEPGERRLARSQPAPCLPGRGRRTLGALEPPLSWAGARGPSGPSSDAGRCGRHLTPVRGPSRCYGGSSCDPSSCLNPPPPPKDPRRTRAPRTTDLFGRAQPDPGPPAKEPTHDRVARWRVFGACRSVTSGSRGTMEEEKALSRKGVACMAPCKPSRIAAGARTVPEGSSDRCGT